MSARVSRTLEVMIRGGFTARALCRVCERSKPIDLEALAAKVGLDYTLWNRRCRCKLTPGCPGWNHFYIGPGWGHVAADARTELRWVNEEWDERLERERLERESAKR